MLKCSNVLDGGKTTFEWLKCVPEVVVLFVFLFFWGGGGGGGYFYKNKLNSVFGFMIQSPEVLFLVPPKIPKPPIFYPIT